MNIHIYTDGSYSKSHPEVCGVGVHFPNEDYKDVSEPFVHRPTNQRAELMAILRAITIVRSHNNERPIVIHTDSKYAIGCCTNWLQRWHQTEWMTANKKPVENQDILRPLSGQLTNVTFHHVKAHTRKQDADAIANDKADQLAKRAILDFLKKSSVHESTCARVSSTSVVDNTVSSDT